MAQHHPHHPHNLGIEISMIPLEDLDVCVREVEFRQAGWPVVFVHGNVSSSPFFFPTMLALPDQFRPIAIDLRGFGGTDTRPVDATRGLRDFADDVRAVLQVMGLTDVHLVGWSMGGGVVMQMAIDEADRVASVTLINPVSPFGFGGTTGTDGRLLAPDGAGSGAGTVNPEFVAALAGDDIPDESPSSARSVLHSFYVAPGWHSDHEETFVTSMMSTAVGPDNYPGEAVPSTTWPGTAPGRRGVLNALAPVNLDLSPFADIDPAPPVLWVRGELDPIISDASSLDLAQLGALGVVPGYPGLEVAPPQPMLAQTRSVLDSYASAGGAYEEVVMPGVGHSPHIEATEEFTATLARFLDSAQAELTEPVDLG
ncbi:alpha/beta hydrolase [Nakamurella flavida]|uniref:Alpha/beta hydrolase n=1 Tax=Nakamurella flavida TaxID=363630 RepID=A0A939C3Z2_9ACTN|nr:alpha/beta hydrolase [Nakamurella flavida]MBM9477541.1 alpha/beta hydrolase [Nakamurella flavida]MDP9779089.1 pimeloyl-ACP methyl ester carboxylesterase [Nakamurella flavida]